ncbi:DDE-type integrase/transposase/recombinase [Sulfurimonas sp. HSL-3221]|uniref:helix-turn-helix domain-containing protein n=1 Tax=Sulfurimonadaceae TaxID=2771471 RepID=UPI001E4D06CD|nr:DDE-type integrase/transposase/recombinase [Sulfurimonas sp. HSL-3221]UFS62734.1 DDE-type integrase/transposase/recombinase [Sulfurimonas sp. HSL-3221]
MHSETEAHKLDRRLVKVEKDGYVQYQGEVYKVSLIIDPHEIVGINTKTGSATRLLARDLKPIEFSESSGYEIIDRDMLDISDETWEKVERRYEGIKPILNGASKVEIEQHAEQMNVHYTTLYRWYKEYRESGTILGLAPRKKGPKPGKSGINSRAEAIIQEMIQKFYLTKQRPNVSSIIHKVFNQCKQENVTPPGKNTIRNRIAGISEYERLKKQGNASIARDKFEPKPGSFNAEYPLQIVQIDHTRADVILVDDETRAPIDRPWLTVMIDLYSRMVVGFHLSLEAPSVTSDALCIANAVLPKDQILLEHGIEEEWDVWGFPQTIHSDNGADFRSESLKRSCLVYGMNYMFRSPGVPSLGGHVERMIKTIMDETHNIPGTTFSNIFERKTYDSEGNAMMTFSEYEKWLLLFLTKIYHKRQHQTLGVSPEAKWREGIFGSALHEGVGYPPKPSDPQTVLLDFLPMVMRTIQRNGVNIDGLNYYDQSLRPFINQIDLQTGKKKQFIFKRDIRDISFVWFYEEVNQVYYKVRLADMTIPRMSLWELKEIRKRLKNAGTQAITPYKLAEAYEELHEHIESSSQKSKKARRQLQKIKNQEHSKQKDPKPIVKTEEPAKAGDESLWDDDDLPVFD